jgi:hypothetical protein
MLITNKPDVVLNTKENKVFKELSEQGFTPWIYTDEGWIKKPIRNNETSNCEVSND